MTIVGCVIGIAGALALGRGAKSLLYEMSGTDPVVIAGAAVLMGSAAGDFMTGQTIVIDGGATIS